MIVVDASVVFKWIVSEDETSTRAARQLRQQYLLGKEKIIAPDILLYEIANIFAYKTKLSFEDVAKAWQSFQSLEIPVVAATEAYIGDCLKFSQRHQISVYDASYVVLAQKRKCRFITADKRLVARVNLPFVHVLSAN